MVSDLPPSRRGLVAASWGLAGLLFLAPLKFGTVVETAGISFFPTSLAEWLLTPWPPFLMPVLAGAMLLLTVAAVGSSRGNTTRPADWQWQWLPVAVWLTVLAGLLPGLIRTTEWDYAILFLFHVAGAAALAWAAALLMRAFPQARPLLLAALSAGVAWSAFGGWLQVPFGGLARAAEQIEAAVRARGGTVNPELLQRLHQNRAFSTFVYPNSFAAHLLLTTPLVTVACYRAGRFIEPARVSRVLLGGLALVLGLGAIWFSGSRAALLAAAAGVSVAVFLQPAFRRWRTAAVIAVLVAGVGGVAILTAGRGGEKLGSVRSRLTYYSAAVRMFEHHPITGVGLGEFYPWYLRLKPAGAEETRQPHNFLLGFASQSGVLGAAAALLLLGLPLYLRYYWGRHHVPFDPVLLSAVEMGLAAWSVHALMDFDIQIPATVTTAAVLPFLSLAPGAAPETGGSHPDETAAVTRGKPVLRLLWTGGPVLLGVLLCLAGFRAPGEHTYARLWSAAGNPRADDETVETLARRAGRLLPLSPYPWALLGRYANQRKDRELAAEAWIESTVRTPHRAGFHTAAAKALLRIGRKREAAIHVGLALQWYPTDPETRALAERLGISLPPTS